MNKGSTLQALVDQLGIAHDEVLVAGDTLNDLAMFEAGFQVFRVKTLQQAGQSGLDAGHDCQLMRLNIGKALAHRLYGRHIGALLAEQQQGHDFLGAQRWLAGRRLERVVFDRADGGAVQAEFALDIATRQQDFHQTLHGLAEDRAEADHELRQLLSGGVQVRQSGAVAEGI